MGLKPLRITTDSAQKKSTSDVAVIDVSGQAITDYNNAVIEYKDAEARKKEMGAALQSFGLPELWKLCVANPDAVPSSVKLRDELGSTVLIVGQDRYSAVDAEAASPVFEALGADIAEFAQFTVKAKFNDTVFLAQKGTDAGPEGSFSTKIYTAYQKALDTATAQLVRDGLLPMGSKSPLATEQVASMRPNFHQTRWKAFPDCEQQKLLHEVCPNVIALKPVVEGAGNTPPAERKKFSVTRKLRT